MISKPVDLIVSNVMHNAADGVKKLEALVKAMGRLLPEARAEIPDVPTEVARKLLCEIAHEASPALVFKSLEAVGAPASKQMISEGLQAVKDMQ